MQPARLNSLCRRGCAQPSCSASRGRGSSSASSSAGGGLCSPARGGRRRGRRRAQRQRTAGGTFTAAAAAGLDQRGAAGGGRRRRGGSGRRCGSCGAGGGQPAAGCAGHQHPHIGVQPARSRGGGPGARVGAGSRARRLLFVLQQRRMIPPLFPHMVLQPAYRPVSEPAQRTSSAITLDRPSFRSPTARPLRSPPPAPRPPRRPTPPTSFSSSPPTTLQRPRARSSGAPPPSRCCSRARCASSRRPRARRRSGPCPCGCTSPTAPSCRWGPGGRGRCGCVAVIGPVFLSSALGTAGVRSGGALFGATRRHTQCLLAPAAAWRACATDVF